MACSFAFLVLVGGGQGTGDDDDHQTRQTRPLGVFIVSGGRRSRLYWGDGEDRKVNTNEHATWRVRSCLGAKMPKGTENAPKRARFRCLKEGAGAQRPDTTSPPKRARSSCLVVVEGQRRNRTRPNTPYGVFGRVWSQGEGRTRKAHAPFVFVGWWAVSRIEKLTKLN